MRIKKVQVPTIEFRIWCEHCSIRIAPHEDRATDDGKSYHPRCYSKLPMSQGKSKVVLSKALMVSGGAHE